HERAGVEILSPALAAVEVGPGVSRSPEQSVRLRFIGSGKPGSGSSILYEVAPAFRSGFALGRYRVKAPDFFAGGGRKRRAVAPHAAVAAGTSYADLVPYGERSQRSIETLLRVSVLLLPDHGPVAPVQCHQVDVRRNKEDTVAQDCRPAVSSRFFGSRV